MSTLSSDEERVSRALMLLTVVLPRVVEDDLRANGALGLTSHRVLMHLRESDDHEMRMIDLAECTAMSPSRITRVVQSLVREGFVVQTPCPVDGRSNKAKLTDSGLARLRASNPAYVGSLRARALDHIAPSQLAGFADKLEALLVGLSDANVSTTGRVEEVA